MTKNILEENKIRLESLLREYQVHASSPYNDGWTKQAYQAEVNKIKEQLNQLHG